MYTEWMSVLIYDCYHKREKVIPFFFWDEGKVILVELLCSVSRWFLLVQINMEK